MKTILCYGDSNTWGFNYETLERFPYGVRWPNVMQKILGDNFRVIEEGLNGRTTALDDPNDDCPEARNGLKYLNPCIRSHYPIDLMIFMLGTNDLKADLFTTVDDIARNMERLIELSRKELDARQGYEPKILLAAPTAIGTSIERSMFCNEFNGKKSIPLSAELEETLFKTSERLFCYFLNAGEITKPNEVDAIHFNREGHRLFGEAAAQKVREIFAQSF
ncbi:GDSL-type esterase/lipase family protein [Caproicibacter sp. BJN0012]|uniref:GDSL-type esterase/lipase family protein n=1 Tax=Caproicibacter sp. BJN0012 TaxID=3110227 RepID=UPI002E0DF67A